jgi:hypothetical protein
MSCPIKDNYVHGNIAIQHLSQEKSWGPAKYIFCSGRNFALLIGSYILDGGHGNARYRYNQGNRM